MSSAIEITGLRKSFSVKTKDSIGKVEAVRGITLTVKYGEIFGF